MILKDKIALITGAGRGIGHEIAIKFATEGSNLVLLSRSKAEVLQTAKEAQRHGIRAVAVEADVSDREQVHEAVNLTVKEFGRVDILVNNAAIQGPIGPLFDNAVDEWIKTININLIGVFLCCHAVLPVMIKNRHGKIINLSGGGATSPRPYFSAYSAAKTAVVRLTETLAGEVEAFNIQVNAIAPGSVNTRMLDQVLDAGERAGRENIEQCKKQLETGGTPVTVPAELALFLASEESDCLTGRLISAVWDDWRNIRKNMPKIRSSDLYTLRRIS